MIIVGEKVETAYEDENEAYLEAQKKYGLGNFLIQHAEPGQEAHTQTFHSTSVVF